MRVEVLFRSTLTNSSMPDSQIVPFAHTEKEKTVF
jgi:hypothetical protein